MIAICPKCGSYKWNKEVDGNQIFCPECGNRWEFVKKSLYVLTGCSGIGKTTTAQEMMKRTADFVVLDADMFHSIMPHYTDEDYFAQVEQIGSLSKNIMQCGKPVIWAKAGNIDMFPKTYHARFFDRIHVLALVCEEGSLRKRMTEGRHITDTDWINSSVDYNNYFMMHNQIGNVEFDTLDTEGKSVCDVAEAVLKWMKEKERE